MVAAAPLAPAQYKLNDRAVGWEQYNKKLEQYNILVKARNFLVFQVGAARGCAHDASPCLGAPGQGCALSLLVHMCLS